MAGGKGSSYTRGPEDRKASRNGCTAAALVRALPPPARSPGTARRVRGPVGEVAYRSRAGNLPNSRRSLCVSAPSSVAGEVAGLLAGGFDRLGDGEVLPGDGLVGDAGVDHRHGKGIVAVQRAVGIETHAPVDQQGGQRVTQLRRSRPCDPFFGCSSVHFGHLDILLLGRRRSQVLGTPTTGPSCVYDARLLGPCGL